LSSESVFTFNYFTSSRIITSTLFPLNPYNPTIRIKTNLPTTGDTKGQWRLYLCSWKSSSDRHSYILITSVIAVKATLYSITTY
ncbi:hypothetical protein O181_123947, partial [Austropuccinia psidii MF-1]|nr:hypothetical protein [Austropuccinia psidii MF-1]